MKYSPLLLSLWVCSALAQAAETKPVLLYSRYFNAEGETRYLPTGTYQDVLQRLQATFEIQVSDQPLTAERLAAVSVVLIANPSDAAVAGHAAPHHCAAADIAVIEQYVAAGGGLIAMGNQENHNLEIVDFNHLLGRFGMQWASRYTDAKPLLIPADTRLVGGLRWAYYTGNTIELVADHAAKPQALIRNDLSIKPLGGPRDEPGVLLATAEPGAGHVVLVTDAGWISNDALSGKGIGPVAIKEHDNFQIFLRLATWAGRVK